MDQKEGEKDRDKRIDDIFAILKTDEKWQRLVAAVEKGSLSYEAALRGFRLQLDVSLEPYDRRTVVGEDGLAREVGSGTSLASQQTLQEPLHQEGGKADSLGDAEESNEATPPRLIEVARVRVARRSVPPPKAPSDPAEYWRTQMKAFYANCGFDIEVPLPLVTTSDLEEWSCSGWDLFYRPADRTVSYERLMAALGHPDHSTLRKDERSRIRWEPAPEGYWFLAETWTVCPRSGKTYEEQLGAAPEGHRVLSLEEWMIFWHIMRQVVPMAFLDPHEYPVLLRNEYGIGEVLQVRSNVNLAAVEIIVRSWSKKLAYKKMGARLMRPIPSAT